MNGGWLNLKNGMEGYKMRAMLEFELPEEDNELKLAINGAEFFSALFDIYNECRRYIRHTAISDEGIKIVESIQGLIPDTVFEIE